MTSTAQEMLGRRGVEPALILTILVSALVHGGLIVLLVTVPQVMYTDPPKIESYTVDLIAPDVVGGTNLVAGPGRRELPPGPPPAAPRPAAEPQGPPPVAARPAPAAAPPAVSELPEPPALPPAPAPPAPDPPKAAAPPAPAAPKPPPPKPPEVVREPPPKPQEAVKVAPAPKPQPPKPEPEAAKPAVAKAAPPAPASKGKKPAAEAPQPAKQAAAAVGKPTPAKVAAQAAPTPGRDPLDKQIAAAVERRSAEARDAAQRDEQISAAVQRRAGQAGAGSPRGSGDSGGPISVGPGSGTGGTPMDLEFILYQGKMEERIKTAWAWAGADRNLHAVVGFSVSPTGEISNIRTVQSSGDRQYDASCERAVRAANPLEPVPEKYRTLFSTVEMTFKPEDMES